MVLIFGVDTDVDLRGDVPHRILHSWVSKQNLLTRQQAVVAIHDVRLLAMYIKHNNQRVDLNISASLQ